LNLALSVLFQLRQINAEKTVHLLVTVRERALLQYQNRVRHVIQYLGKWIPSLLGLHVLDKEKNQYIFAEVNAEKDNCPPHGNLTNQQGIFTLHDMAANVEHVSGKAYWGYEEICDPIIVERRHKESKQYIKVCNILLCFLHGYEMLDLFLDRLRADFFITEVLLYPNMDEYVNDKPHY